MFYRPDGQSASYGNGEAKPGEIPGEILTGREDVDPEMYFTRAEMRSGTRGHGLKLFKSRCRTGQRANFFTQRVINGWNGLPEGVVNAPSISAFKRRYDQCRSNEGDN